MYIAGGIYSILSHSGRIGKGGGGIAKAGRGIASPYNYRTEFNYLQDSISVCSN